MADIYEQILLKMFFSKSVSTKINYLMKKMTLKKWKTKIKIQKNLIAREKVLKTIQISLCSYGIVSFSSSL